MSSKRLDKILFSLKKIYGTKLELAGANKTELVSIYEHYKNVQKDILLSQSFNSYVSHPEYTKAGLICEAVKLFLSEIAPARNGKVKTKKYKNTNEDYSHLVSPDNARIADPRFTNINKENAISKAIRELCSKGIEKLSTVDKFDLVSEIASEFGVEVKDLMKKVESGACSRISEDIEPEVPFGSKEAGQTFDGKDLSGDYAKDRDPNGDHGYDEYEYNDLQQWLDDSFLIVPEQGDPSDSGEFSPTGHLTSDEVFDRYYKTPGPNPNDYGDDRNVVKISKGITPNEPDVIDQLKKEAGRHPEETTYYGLPKKLEKGVGYKKGKMTKNGVKDENFYNDPRKSPQREIPKPNDLQSDNKNRYNEERHLALKVINQLNKPSKIRKVVESITTVANETNTPVSIVVKGYLKEAKGYIKENLLNLDDPVYQMAMVSVTEMINNFSLRGFIKNCQDSYDAEGHLYNFLINKAKEIGLFGDDAKKFAFSAHSALLDTNVNEFH